MKLTPSLISDPYNLTTNPHRNEMNSANSSTNKKQCLLSHSCFDVNTDCIGFENWSFCLQTFFKSNSLEFFCWNGFQFHNRVFKAIVQIENSKILPYLIFNCYFFSKILIILILFQLEHLRQTSLLLNSLHR